MVLGLQNKKGIHGIGILLIFLAIIIISVSASALVINQAHKLAQDGGKSYAEVKDMAKFFHIVEVGGFDGRDQELTHITFDAKLLGESPPLDLNKVTISVGEEDIRTILKYRGIDAPVENSNEGYNTWAPEEFGELTYAQYVIDTDLDDDGLDDYLGLNATHFTIDLSSHSTLISYPLGVDLSGGSVTLNVNQLITNGERYGTIVMQGTTTGADVIDASVTVTLSPYHLGGGYFTVEYLIQAPRSKIGRIIPGDVVRFHVETYAPIQTDDIIDIKLIYHDLETTAKKIYVGNTFPNNEKVLLYPKA